jgi:tetratricopeptide (TPR) repeat protein
MRQDSMAKMNLVGCEGRSMAMSTDAVERPTPAAPTLPSDEVADGPGGARHARPPVTDRQLHAQNNDRVYQAAGDQYIIGHAPTPAAARNTLPRDIAAFTGRSDELNDLISMVTALIATGEILPIFAISGMPGVGKTKFAVHVGHRLSASFPDGQMFADLHAHTAGKAPVDPADALEALLTVDGVRPHDIPDDVDGRSALWRALMAGRRLILILDNVASHRQVEPLLPGTPGCLVLVTSRRRLTGLGARHAATSVPLAPLPPGPATDLFARLAGRTLDDGQRYVVTELARLCGYLPLAISLLAARLRAEPLWQMESLVAELVAAQDRLAFMCAEDIQVKAAFSLSYQRLPPVRRRFFRRLGLTPGSDIDAYAAAALGDVGLPAARRHLAALYDDHLVDQPVHGRYRLHDLVGVYTRALVAGDPAEQRDQAIERLLDYYEQAATSADRHIAPRQHRATCQQPRFPMTVPALADATQAAAWMDAELPNLTACAMYAMSNGDDRRLVGMSAALSTFLRRAGSYRQSLALHRAAADAAGRLGSPAAQAAALYHVGVLLRRAGDYPAATDVLREARGLYRDLGDQVGEADVLTVAGIVRRLAGDYFMATETLGRALACFQSLGDTSRQAEVLSELAVIRWLTEDYPAATQLLDQALVLHREAGGRLGQADVLLNLAMVRRMTHDYAPATRILQQAMILYRSVGSQLGLAHTRLDLGVICRLTGDRPGATRFLDESLQIYREVGDRLGQAHALKELGILRRLDGDHLGAVQALREALPLYRGLGNRRGQAATLQARGAVQWLSGNLLEGEEDLTEALTIYRDLGSRAGQAEVLNDLGELLLIEGDPRALNRFRSALPLAQEVGDPLEEARALEGVGRRLLRDGDTGQAILRLRAALKVYVQIGAPRAQEIGAILASQHAHSPGNASATS